LFAKAGRAIKVCGRDRDDRGREGPAQRAAKEHERLARQLAELDAAG